MTDWPGTADSVARVHAADGFALTVERFDPRSPSGAVLLFLHGIGSYAGPYRRFARDLADAGVTVYLPDMRGHGRSGPPGRMGTPRTVLSDVRALVEHVRAAHPGAELVLGGESMGGLFSLAYTASNRPGPDRLLLLVPALRPHVLAWIQAGAARLTARGIPLADRLGLHAPIPGEPVRDLDFHTRAQTDPLMLDRTSVGYLATLVAMIAGATRRYPSKVDQACLIVVAGADLVVDARATRAAAGRMPHARLVVAEGAWHNLLWDPTARATTDRIASWLAGNGVAQA